MYYVSISFCILRDKIPQTPLLDSERCVSLDFQEASHQRAQCLSRKLSFNHGQDFSGANEIKVQTVSQLTVPPSMFWPSQFFSTSHFLF